MICVAILTHWFLVLAGPAPVVVGEFASEPDCLRAHVVLSRTFSLDGKPTWLSER